MDITIQRIGESPFVDPEYVAAARFVFHGAAGVEPGGLGRFHAEAEAALRAYPDLIGHVATLPSTTDPMHDESAATVLVPIPIGFLDDEPARTAYNDQVIEDAAEAACYATQRHLKLPDEPDHRGHHGVFEDADAED